MNTERHTPQVPEEARKDADDAAGRKAVEREQNALDNTRKGYGKTWPGAHSDVGKGQSKDNPFMPGNDA